MGKDHNDTIGPGVEDGIPNIAVAYDVALDLRNVEGILTVRRHQAEVDGRGRLEFHLEGAGGEHQGIGRRPENRHIRACDRLADEERHRGSAPGHSRCQEKSHQRVSSSDRRRQQPGVVARVVDGSQVRRWPGD